MTHGFNDFGKMKIALTYWLFGMAETNPNYLKCLEALEMASKYHSGRRKDGVTLELEHQITIAHYIRTLSKSLLYPCESICVALLHDIVEDYDVSTEEITLKFGEVVGRSIYCMTKLYEFGDKKTNGKYFGDISEDPIASIIKGGDRIHNLQSMLGVFSIEKQKEYVEEAELHILPAIKVARRKFHGQELAYENIKQVMNSQIQLIKMSWNE